MRRPEPRELIYPSRARSESVQYPRQLQMEIEQSSDWVE